MNFDQIDVRAKARQQQFGKERHHVGISDELGRSQIVRGDVALVAAGVMLFERHIDDLSEAGHRIRLDDKVLERRELLDAEFSPRRSMSCPSRADDPVLEQWAMPKVVKRRGQYANRKVHLTGFEHLGE